MTARGYAERPAVGQRIRLPGGDVGTVLAVYQFGTCDVEYPNGKVYRLTGLGWL